VKYASHPIQNYREDGGERLAIADCRFPIGVSRYGLISNRHSPIANCYGVTVVIVKVAAGTVDFKS
jgi:hypothetical protein